MASPFNGFRSDSGVLHEDEHDAWIDDLNHWLKGAIDNEAVRSAVSKALIADALNGNHLSAIIAGIKRSAPPKDEVA